ncbi:Hsp33 family molecular chaperone HslO [Thiomicrorhabdus sp. zzn3]|uniref:Hsp33 family molecular chaperone HslO n=1 Tax=Thiomicrorhabdus sp. zzn3 TaxID=3039775 RepID=UPI002436B95F|nr:Hsp33 family molecular chaperone HslO [Thiomicrorhabdus sp. zzn3]MDG6777494.1 Hsp33 family molecular chaperone HslO [Thiomicrorhabdus sp. zzn3]
MSDNAVQRFLFKELNIRGQHIRLQESWQKMVTDRHYPQPIIKLLGELTAMSVLMANGMKHQGRITFQVQGSGPVTLLVVEVTHDLKIRGVAKTNQTVGEQTSLDELLGDGQILMTLENTQTNHHFQSFVPREGHSISEAFEAFLSQSEQLPSKIWLAADEAHIGGVMIQKMPETDKHDEDGWDRITHLTTTVQDDELLNLQAEELLHRLFHEETIELFKEEEVIYECPQDRECVEAMLKSLGEEELRRLLEEQGEIVIHNEICNFHMRFNAEDIDALFTDQKKDDDVSTTLQ